jgi:signal transduction histidine kinase
MPLHSTHQPLVRRLLGHYLMFGLTSIVVLSIGALWLGESFLHEGHNSELLSRIKEFRSLIVADQTHNRGVGTQTLIHQLSAEDWVAYAGVLTTDGKIAAHSKPSRIGHTGERRLIGGGSDAVIERHVVWDDGQQMREYWVPLTSGDRNFGCLQVGALDEGTTNWVNRISDLLPFAILAPLLVLIVGAVCLRATTRTSSAIEDQLCAVFTGEAHSEFRLKPLAEHSPAAQGWNQLVERALGRGAVSQLETKLSESLGGLHEKRSERVLNSVPDGVALTDTDGCLTYANRAFCVLLQQPTDAAKWRGRPIRDLFPSQANLQMTSNQESRPVVFEVSLGQTMADGVLRVGRSPLLGDENSAVPQHVWSVRDITQQKLADEMRTQFVYSATHELRTPLANIRAYAETLTLNEMTDPEQQKSFLNVINSEATRLGRFVEELLNVSQMEAGSLTLARTEVDTERLLMEIADKVRPQMQQKGILFDTLLPPKLPKLHVDKDKFTAALVNLLGNAAKYTPEHGRVSLKVVSGLHEIQICVEDTGFGISREDLPKLFTKFFRSADQRVRDLPGSGLGLAFTQEVIRLHGGKLVVHSELNKGSQFTLTMSVA